MFGGKIFYAFTVGAADGLALSSEADIWIWSVPFKCKPIRVGVNVTTATSGNASVVKFDRKVSSASRGDGDVGTLTIPDATAIGACIYQDSDYVAAGTGYWDEYLEEGDLVYVQVTTLVATGKVLPWLVVEIMPERPANNSGMTATSN